MSNFVGRLICAPLLFPLLICAIISISFSSHPAMLYLSSWCLRCLITGNLYLLLTFTYVALPLTPSPLAATSLFCLGVCFCLFICFVLCF